MDPEAKEALEQSFDLLSHRAAPFHVFVLVCDRGRKLSCQAALRYQNILTNRRRVMPRLFCEMLDFCRENYRTLWQDYAGSKLEVDLGGFVDLLESLRTRVAPAEFAELEQELAQLARTLYRAGFFLFPSRAQKEAYVDLIIALRRSVLPARAEKVQPRQGEPAGAINPESRQGAVPGTARLHLVPLAGKRSEDGAASLEPAPSVSQPPRAPGARSLLTCKTLLPALPGPDAAWVKGTLRLACVKVTEEARQVKTFSFASDKNAWFHYKPGQFVTIEPRIGGKAVPRSYTIASTPTRPGLLEITVKRVPGGVVSNWLHDNMTVGQELDGRGPFGKFTCLNFPRDKYLFLSAGSGITPMMSMLRYLYDLAAPVDVIFFYSAATEQDIVFRRELNLYAERDPHIHLFVSLTGEPADGRWDGLRGRLDNEMIHRIAPDFMERMVLACGPGGFMDKAKQLLAGNNFPLESQFDEESFVPKQAQRLDRPTRGEAGEKCKIVFVKSGKSQEICAEETILEAAEKCGIEIPSSCRQGRCGTCRATKLSGEVIMADQEALDPDEIAGGEILTCIGQPKSSIVEVEI